MLELTPSPPKQATEAKDEQLKQALQVQVDQLRMETQIINVLIGAVTGLGGTAVVHETLAAAEEMRKLTIIDSGKFEGATDADPKINDKDGDKSTSSKDPFVLGNLTGKSIGGQWDLSPAKTGGVRVDLDLLCGASNERCVKQKNSDGSIFIDANGKTQLELNKEGKVLFQFEKMVCQ